MAGMTKKSDWIEDCVQRYTDTRPLYAQFTTEMENLIKKLIETESLDYSIIQSRCKELESFKKKISRPGKYNADPLLEMTDLAGIRVILYYTEDVPLVGKLIQSQFVLDPKSFMDKSDLLEPHEFGYQSKHYVVSLRETRTNLPEWKGFEGLKAEIQVRTVLQHAWAAISHAIDYKNEMDVPKTLRRRLFRLSAVLELGDEQFSVLRKERKTLTSETEDQIKLEDPNVELNLDTVKQFLSSSVLVRDIADAALDCGFLNHDDDDSVISFLLSHCRLLGLSTINELSGIFKRIPKDSYTARLWTLISDPKVPNRNWIGSPAFFVVLVLIFAKHADLDQKKMTSLGWDPGIVQRILHAARSTHA